MGKMSLFSLEKVLPSLAGRKIDGKDMRVPIGHGDGMPSCLPHEQYIAGSELTGVGRMGQLGKIHYINTKAFLESARHVMVVHGGYTDAEVDVLCEFFPCLHLSIQICARSLPVRTEVCNYSSTRPRKLIRGLAQAYMTEIDKGQLYTRYHALSITN